MFKYTARKPFQANFRPGEQPGRNGHGAPPIQELGALLRERREAVGATLAEVETATRIRQKYLAALESDEWQLLPGEVIGRGFLRNYATYLGLDSTETVERRRAVADPSLAGALSDISAGAPLPPLRKVDYRPKDVAIREEPEGIERRELRLAPILTVVALFGLLWTIWWGFNAFGNRVSAGVSGMVGGAQTRIADARATDAPTWTPAPTAIANGGQLESAPVGGDNGTNSTPVVAD
ncbi:MAG: helix-turn-helix domain-containing protein, partial [Chloroflexota bacterium]|nr:helix-turn-helix domain-containing protein [Chloroflexota bacterium]